MDDERTPPAEPSSPPPPSDGPDDEPASDGPSASSLRERALEGDLEAIRELRELGTAETAIALGDILAEGDDDTWPAAAEALAALGPPREAFPTILPATGRPPLARIVRAAELALASLGSPPEPDGLATLRRSAGARVAAIASRPGTPGTLRRRAMALLGSLGGAYAARVVDRAIRDAARHPDLARVAAETASDPDAGAFRARLAEVLADPDASPEARLRAAQAIAGAPPASRSESVEAILADHGPDLARTTLDEGASNLHPGALSVLAAAAPDEARPRLRRALSGASSYRVRAAAARLLGEVGEPSDRARLDAVARSDPSRAVRRAARDAATHLR